MQQEDRTSIACHFSAVKTLEYFTTKREPQGEAPVSFQLLHAFYGGEHSIVLNVGAIHESPLPAKIESELVVADIFFMLCARVFPMNSVCLAFRAQLQGWL